MLCLDKKRKIETEGNREMREREKIMIEEEEDKRGFKEEMYQK